MKKIVSILLLSGCIAILYGQKKDAVLDSVANNFTRQLLVFPQEKIYLHTDKPYYITGEKIFFRAFLLNAFSNKQIAPDRYIYVELINPADTIAQRLKIRSDSTGLYYGAILLPEDLPQGSYKIRAYTQYMTNQDESSFFSKRVQIIDPQSLELQTQTDFQFAESGKINASLRFLDAKTQNVIQPQSILLRVNQNQSFIARPDKEGWMRFKVNIPDKATTRVLYVELRENRRIFKQYLRIPYPEGDFDVSFYPEGGHLIAEQTSNVTFKATNTDGTGLNITGEITDSKGNIVAEIKTVYDGMGEFFINPLAGEHYQAVCRYGDRTLRFDLPEIQTNALALKVLSRGDKLLISVNRNVSAPCPELYLIIHSNGLIAYSEPWDASKEFIAFDKSVFSSGISHILLLTKDLQVLSERLLFVLNNDNGLAKYKTQKNIYRKREQVESEVQLKDEMLFPLKGNFSIAITNDKEVIADTTAGILSDILLRSELRGPVENPEYYLQKGNKNAELAADLLMKINGWTRYAIPDVIRGKLSYPKIPFEASQKISGTVKSGLIPKPAKNFNMSLISLAYGFFDMVKTDENGRYLFDNFEFPDSTKYVIQALNSKGKGKQMIDLYVDEDTFPEIHTAWTEPVISISKEENKDSVLTNYVAKADLYYTYENGIRTVHLPEVQIKGIHNDKEKDQYKSVYYSDPDYSFSSETIEKSGVIYAKDLLYRVPGVMVSGNSIRIRGAGGPPLIVIDDMPLMATSDQETIDNLNMLSINDIGKIDVLKNISNTALYGMRGANGIIVIYTKRGEWHSALPTFNIKQLTPLGYQSPVEFYSPKYDTQESINNSKPDLRTTIYWKPNVLTDDEGKAHLDFYTADDPATYSVIIEGVSEDGKLIHYRGNAEITVK